MKTSLLPIVACLALASCAEPPPASGGGSELPPRCTPAWNQLVDQRLGITDPSGHGPDIGSNEWQRAVSLKSGVEDAAGHGPDYGSDEWCRAVDFKVFGRR